MDPGTPAAGLRARARRIYAESGPESSGTGLLVAQQCVQLRKVQTRRVEFGLVIGSDARIAEPPFRNARWRNRLRGRGVAGTAVAPSEVRDPPCHWEPGIRGRWVTARRRSSSAPRSVAAPLPCPSSPDGRHARGDRLLRAHPDQRPAGRPARPPAAPDDWTTVRPTFVVDLTALLLLGTGAGVIVSAACTVTRLLGESPGRSRPAEMLLPATAPLLALEAAAFTHLALGGTIGSFAWPWQAVPIAAAVLAYCLVLSAVFEIALPLLSSRPLTASWPAVVLAGCPSYLTAAGLAVATVELIERRMWTVALVASSRCTSSTGVRRSPRAATTRKTAARTRWRRSTTACRWSIQAGIVTLWNHALERLLGCPADRALGQPLWSVVPVLSETELPRALQEAARTQKPVRLANLGSPWDGWHAHGGPAHPAGCERHDHAVARRHGDVARRASPEAKRRALCPDCRRGQRRAVGVGPAARRALCVCAVARSRRTGRGGRPVPSPGMAGPRPRSRHRLAQGGHRGPLVGRHGLLSTRASHPRGRQDLPPVPLPCRGGTWAGPAAGSSGRFADRRHRTRGARPGAAPERRHARPPHRPVQPGGVRRTARPPPRGPEGAPRPALRHALPGFRTASRSSTTVWGTSSAISCSPPCPGGSRGACGPATRWRASAATSSRCS